METDLFHLYRQMFRARCFEETVRELWQRGEISGEMHLGTGEEAVAAGVVSHLREGDALALDHRGAPPLLVRGLDPTALFAELLGLPLGLCGGRGGHMHLFSRDHLAASSGIVGASGPLGAGFALAASHLRPGGLAVSLFGEGAANQGMLMETMNLAVVWKLPLLLVCKDNRWAITTESAAVTGGLLPERARAFGLRAAEADGLDVEEVYREAGRQIERIRAGEGPAFLLLRCSRPEGHFLGDPVLRILRHPAGELGRRAGPFLRSVASPRGAPLPERVRGTRRIAEPILGVDRSLREGDPLAVARARLAGEEERLAALEEEAAAEIRSALDRALPLLEGPS